MPISFVVKNGSKTFCAEVVANAGSGIGHTHGDIIAGRRLLRVNGMTERDVFGLDGQAAADLHRIARVDCKIEDRQFELCRIDHRRPQAPMQPRFDAGGATHRALQQVAHADHRFIEIERPRLEPLTAREREQLIGQLRAAFGSNAHVTKALHQLAVDARGGKALFEEPDIAEHDGEEIIEIVGHA